MVFFRKLYKIADEVLIRPIVSLFLFLFSFLRHVCYYFQCVVLNGPLRHNKK